MSTEFYWIAVAVITIVSSARLTRLLTVDEFPPTKWLRNKYHAAVGDDWGLLMFCGYCASFWITAGIALWGWAVDFDEPWFLVNGILAASYLAAMTMARDGDEA